MVKVNIGKAGLMEISGREYFPEDLGVDKFITKPNKNGYFWVEKGGKFGIARYESLIQK
jgi:hypothetical protein